MTATHWIPWTITRDGEPVAVVASGDAAFVWLLQHQGQSVHHATTHEGWAYAEAEPWSSDDERVTYRPDQIHAMARQACIGDAEHRRGHREHGGDKLTRANCSACVLGGYHDPDDDEHDPADGPNYAGWARVYVEACEEIPARWSDAFARELASDNVAYAAALARSIATFGARIAQ